MSKESGDYAKKSAEFKRWLALYFIKKGNWKLTDKAVEEFGTDVAPKQTMEFAEIFSDREREERTEYRVGLTAEEKKRIAHMKIADMIDEGKVEGLYDDGYLINGKISWKDKSIRVTVIRKLTEKLEKDPRDIIGEDFNKNRLGGLLSHYYNGSPYEVTKEAFPELNIKQWEMAMAPHRFYSSKENRIAAVKWLVEKLRKDPRDLTREYFYSNRLSGLCKYYNNSPYEAVKEAFPEMGIKPWEMLKTPREFYEKKENRVAAVRWLAEKLKKDPRDLTAEDFNSNRLRGLLNHYYNNSPYEAVKEAFPEMDIKPWEIVVTPCGVFDNKENRVAAVKWFVDKLGKDPRDITWRDFNSNRLGGLLCKHYNNSPYEALKEAGLVAEADESYMCSSLNLKYRSVPSSKEAREAARKLARNAKKSDKPVSGKARGQKNSL